MLPLSCSCPFVIRCPFLLAFSAETVQGPISPSLLSRPVPRGHGFTVLSLGGRDEQSDDLRLGGAVTW